MAATNPPELFYNLNSLLEFARGLEEFPAGVANTSAKREFHVTCTLAAEVVQERAAIVFEESGNAVLTQLRELAAQLYALGAEARASSEVALHPWRLRCQVLGSWCSQPRREFAFCCGTPLVAVRHACVEFGAALSAAAGQAGQIPGTTRLLCQQAARGVVTEAAQKSDFADLLEGLHEAFRTPIVHGAGLRDPQTHFEQLTLFSGLVQAMHLRLGPAAAGPPAHKPVEEVPYLFQYNVEALPELDAEVAKKYAAGQCGAAVRLAFNQVLRAVKASLPPGSGALRGVPSPASMVDALFNAPATPSWRSPFASIQNPNEYDAWRTMIRGALQLLVTSARSDSFGPLSLNQPRDALTLLSLADLMLGQFSQGTLSPFAHGSLFVPALKRVAFAVNENNFEMGLRARLLERFHASAAAPVGALWASFDYEGATFHAFTVIDRQLRAHAKKERSPTELVDILLGGPASSWGQGISNSQQRTGVQQFLRGALGAIRNPLMHGEPVPPELGHAMPHLCIANYALQMMRVLQGQGSFSTLPPLPLDFGRFGLLHILGSEVYAKVLPHYSVQHYQDAVYVARHALLECVQMIGKQVGLSNPSSLTPAQLLEELCCERKVLRVSPGLKNQHHTRDFLLGVLAVTDEAQSLANHRDPMQAFEQLWLLSSSLELLNFYTDRKYTQYCGINAPLV